MKTVFRVVFFIMLPHIVLSQTMEVHTFGGTIKFVISTIESITFSSYAPPPADSLLAFWPLNGNAADSSGNGHDGTVTSAIPALSRFGSPNGSYYFNGTDAFIDMGAIHPDAINHFSLSSWIRPTLGNSLSNASIIGDAGGYAGFRLYQTADSIFFEAQASPGSYATVAWGVTPSDTGKWAHIVATSDYGLIRIYVNGSVKQEKSGAPGREGSRNLEMGRDTNLNTYYWLGTLDDVRIYNKLLSASEIEALFLEGGFRSGL
jgi:hypothetical protein